MQVRYLLGAFICIAISAASGQNQHAQTARSCELKEEYGWREDWQIRDFRANKTA